MSIYTYLEVVYDIIQRCQRYGLQSPMIWPTLLPVGLRPAPCASYSAHSGLALYAECCMGTDSNHTCHIQHATWTSPAVWIQCSLPVCGHDLAYKLGNTPFIQLVVSYEFDNPAIVYHIYYKRMYAPVKILMSYRAPNYNCFFLSPSMYVFQIWIAF